jgi:peroxiredoxin
MKSFYGLIVMCSVAVAMVSCSTDTEKESTDLSSTLHVKLKGVEGGKLYLQELVDKSWVNLDSAEKYTGEASFTMKRNDPDYFRLVDAKGNMGIVIVSPGEDVSIEGDLKDMVNTFKSTDSKVNAQYYEFHRRLAGIRSNEELWVKKYKSFMESKSTEDSAKHYMTLLRKMQDSSDVYIKVTIDSIMPSFAVFSLVNYLTLDKEFDYVYGLADRIKNEMPNTKYSRLFVGEIARMKEYRDDKARKDSSAQVVVGKPAPDFTLNDVDKQEVSLSSFKGKYVLIDFWASWCGPCRAENPNVVKLYKKYKGKNFEILGVSLDGNEKLWKDAIAKDGLTWRHVSDLMQWNSPVVAQYQIDGIPATVLVDPKGIVVAKNLRGQELEVKLEELLK